MKILHTSDWHLGRLLMNERRDAVFARFLDWLIDTMKREACDALLISGDVFDTTVPGTAAQTLYYSFLARLRSETPCRAVVVTGGNHDSPMLLNAPKAVLSALSVTVIGRATPDPADEVVLLTHADGTHAAVVCAVPFLRESDLHTLTDEDTQRDRRVRLIEAVEKHYRAVTDAALNRHPEIRDQIPLIAMGHLFAAGGTTGTAERELYVGSLADVPDSIFPAEIDYLALGHLHKPQVVAKNPAHRYSGSPIALDFSESASRHVVNLVTFEGKTPAVTELTVPAFDRLVQIEGDAATILEKVKEAAADPTPGFLCVEHTGSSSAPELVGSVASLLAQSPLKLLRLTDRAIRRTTLSHREHAESVEALTPESAFDLCLEKSDIKGEEADRLRVAYRTILEELATREAE